MTKQTECAHSLVGSPAGMGIARLRALTVAAIMAISGVSGGFGQQPESTPPQAAKPAAETKPSPAPKQKMAGEYSMHSSVELGGVVTANKDGSSAMWSTMVNEGTGPRMLNQSLTLRTTNPSKTPFFDTLSTSSVGYGGEPLTVSYLNISKGKYYDFAGSFRRDRNYFDYNLLANSLLSTATPTNPALIPEPSSLHIFNTVRRNTDALFTLFPVSLFSFRVGYNHNTHEGPTYSTIHGGGDVQVVQYFRNSIDTYIAGVDYKLAKRTTLSYDQFFGLYRGDSFYQLAPTPFTLADGTPTSLGVNTLVNTVCPTGSKNPEISNGIVNPFCSQTLVQSQVAPTRTTFPTEQFRFSSHYWDKVAFNGRIAYSSDVLNVNHFNETFNGLVTRTTVRQEIDTGALGDGRLAHNKRTSLNGDFGIEAELNRYFAISDAFNFRNFRVAGKDSITSQVWDNTGTPVPPASLNVTTPLSSLTLTTETTPGGDTINQEIERNTILGIVTVTPQVKLSGGWRFDNRHISHIDDHLTWHQNGLLLGAVVIPSNKFRFNVNFDTLNWKSQDADTPSNTYTREAPDKAYHVRVRATVNPAKWINFAVTANDFTGRNDDQYVNNRQHSHNFSFATQVIPNEKFSFDLNYSYDDVYSRTDLCYVFTPNVNYGVPPGAQNRAGTCQFTTLAATTPLYLGNGVYDAPVNFFTGAVSWAPSKYFQFNGGARVTDTSGSAEFLNPLMVPGSLQSTVISPFGDLLVHIAPQWAWHGNWVHHGYNEAGPPGPSPREFHGEVITLGVQYAF